MKPATQTAAVRECRALASRAESAAVAAAQHAQQAKASSDLAAEERDAVLAASADAEHYYRLTAANVTAARAFAWLAVIVNAVTLAVIAYALS